MLKRLKNLFMDKPADDFPVDQHDIATAVAALMVEVMLMDGRLDDAEHTMIASMLQRRFRLDDDEIQVLVARATKAADKAHDLFQFTSRIIRAYPIEQRSGIIRELWSVAMADGHADAYEEQLIRRVAELIGVHHQHFIAAKLQARQET